MASWLVRSSPEQAVWVRDLAGDTELCSWVRHLTLTVPLSTHPGAVEILQPLHATETGISSGSYESVKAPRLHTQLKELWLALKVVAGQSTIAPNSQNQSKFATYIQSKLSLEQLNSLLKICLYFSLQGLLKVTIERSYILFKNFLKISFGICTLL